MDMRLHKIVSKKKRKTFACRLEKQLDGSVMSLVNMIHFPEKKEKKRHLFFFFLQMCP